jgi:adenine phosphoribosyltransferase
MSEYLKSKIARVQDFPKKGILFYDLTPIFSDGAAFSELILQLEKLAHRFMPFDKIVGIEARGFIVGSALALACDVGFVPIRRCGKLPGVTHRIAYDLEYGQGCIEIHQNDIMPSERILIVDDILATGGTAFAAAELIRDCGAQVAGFIFVASIAGLQKEPIAEPDKIACLMELP